MNPRDFCYWLRGFIELTGTHNDWTELDAKQWKIIREHLDKVFNQEPSVDKILNDIKPRPYDRYDPNKRLCSEDLNREPFDSILFFGQPGVSC